MVLSAIAFVSVAPAAQFDLSPEQRGRIHVEKSEKAAAAIAPNFKFAKEGHLTVTTSPWDPPVGTYATDAKTVVGTDPDITVLIAETLGRRWRPPLRPCRRADDVPRQHRKKSEIQCAAEQLLRWPA